jgi:hypothetical protein
VLLEAEGPIEEIQCANWAPLHALVTHDGRKQVLSQVRQWLYWNEYDRSRYEYELDNIFEITIPVDDGPFRGVSTFAKKDLEPLTVLGPYAGALHTSDASLEKAIKGQGSYNTLAYLFQTRSSKRAIDAFASGNVTKLTNTSQLQGHAAWKKNNVVPVLFGKNLVFYITVEKVAKGEELLVDYGPNYNPLERTKQEPLED